MTSKKPSRDPYDLVGKVDIFKPGFGNPRLYDYRVRPDRPKRKRKKTRDG